MHLPLALRIAGAFSKTLPNLETLRSCRTGFKDFTAQLTSYSRFSQAAKAPWNQQLTGTTFWGQLQEDGEPLGSSGLLASLCFTSYTFQIPLLEVDLKYLPIAFHVSYLKFQSRAFTCLVATQGQLGMEKQHAARVLHQFMQALPHHAVKRLKHPSQRRSPILHFIDKDPVRL